MSRCAAFLALLAGAGCAGRTEVYPGADVVEVPGFELVLARDLEMTGTQLRSGELVYTGDEDVRESFRDYMGAMARRGWTTTRADVTKNRATGTLTKDDRSAQVEFVQVKDDRTKATILIAVRLAD